MIVAESIPMPLKNDIKAYTRQISDVKIKYLATKSRIVLWFLNLSFAYEILYNKEVSL